MNHDASVTSRPLSERDAAASAEAAFFASLGVTWLSLWGPAQYYAPGMSLACVSYSIAACNAIADIHAQYGQTPKKALSTLFCNATWNRVHNDAARLNGGRCELVMVSEVFDPAVATSIQCARDAEAPEGALTNWDVDVVAERVHAWVSAALGARRFAAACLTLRNATSCICVTPWTVDAASDPTGGIVWLFDSHGKLSHRSKDTVLVGYYISHGDTAQMTAFVRDHMLPRIYGADRLQDVMIDVYFFSASAP